MDRDRDRRFDDRRCGESYRPSDRLGRPPSRGYIRSTRSPPRNRSPRPVADTWVPPKSNRLRSRSPVSFRRRSRSPPFRGRDAGVGHFQHRGRTRSPSRKFSPRRDERPRSPLRSSWRSRSPYGRGRSPRASRARTPKRIREPSPSGYDNRSPKRERLASPASEKYMRDVSQTRRISVRETGARRMYPTRSRSPVDRGRRGPYPECGLRRRSPSPLLRAPSAHTSSQGSAATSRPSSPPIHPDRLNLEPLDAKSRSSVNQSTRPPRDSRPSAPAPSHQVKSPIQESRPSRREETRTASPNEGEQSIATMAETGRDLDVNEAPRPMQPQTSSAPAQSNEARPSRNPPSNPSNHTTLQRASPPSGPSNGPMSLYTQSRGSNISLLSAPTRPRGGPSFAHRDPIRDAAWAGAPSVRRGPAPSVHGPPTGPRSSFVPASLGHDNHRHSSYRHSNNASTTYPRSQRFANHLSGLPSIIPGGKLLPSVLDSATEKRLAQLEADKERLLEQIAEKQRIKRAGLRDWDRLDRESATGALKSELAEGHLQRMAEGESIGGGSAF